MEWNELYNGNKEPTFNDIEKFVDNGLWQSINKFIKKTYNILPVLSYSCCSEQPGWNVKYKKSGKSLCTLYPMEGYFIALVVIGNKEVDETELILPSCSEHIQDLYKNNPSSLGGKWLMINVTDKKILEDVETLIKIRVLPRQKERMH